MDNSVKQAKLGTRRTRKENKTQNTRMKTKKMDPAMTNTKLYMIMVDMWFGIKCQKEFGCSPCVMLMPKDSKNQNMFQFSKY